MKWILKNEWAIGLLALLLFLPFLGNVHLFDWDEINFAESAREMMLTGDYFSVQINYQRFWEKPPLFFWMQVLSMRLFGINEFAARFPNAICGVITLLLFFRLGKKLFDVRMARIWVMVYLGTFLSFLYFKTGIIDPWFNLFIFLAIYRIYYLTLDINVLRWRTAMWVGIWLGLAVLTKGPVAIIIVGLCYAVFVVAQRFRFYINGKELGIIAGSVLVICFLWFGVDLIKNGPWFLGQFIEYQYRLLTTGEANHGQPFFYHWVVLLIGCFPASVFFIQGMVLNGGTPVQHRFKQWMLILFWVHLLLFSMVTTKIVHYSSLCWFPMGFLAALFIYRRTDSKQFLHPALTGLLVLLGLVLSLAIGAVPYLLMNKQLWVQKLEDDFAKGNLEAAVNWSWADGFGGFILLVGVVYFVFSKNRILKTNLLFASVTICCLLTAVILAPKIEAISQRSNIEFFEARQGEDCYVETYGYKSYATYYYTKKQPFKNFESTKIDWLLRGAIDKPAYFSVKVNKAHELDTIAGLKKLYGKNGFVFYKREKVTVNK